MSISSSERTRFILKVLLFLLLLSIPVGFAELKLRNDQANDLVANRYRYQGIFRGSADPAVLIVGSSHAAHGIIPSLVDAGGRGVYNCAFDAAGPSFTYDLFTRVIRPFFGKPGAIIYELNWYAMDSRRMRRKLSQDYRYMPVAKVLKVADHQLMPFDFLWLTHEDDIYRAVKASFKKHRNDSFLIRDFDRGYVPHETTYFKDTDPKYRIDSAELQKVVGLIRLAKKEGIPFLMVQTPEYLADRNRAAMETNNRIIERVARENGVPFLNYNEELRSAINADRSCFSDTGHLNTRGAHRFSTVFSADLHRVGFRLPAPVPTSIAVRSVH